MFCIKSKKILGYKPYPIDDHFLHREKLRIITIHKAILEKLVSPNIMKFTNQELFWKGKQGDNYINRNAIGYRAFNIGRNLLRNKIDIKSAAEIGPNIGHNLNVVKNIYPNIETFGIEINKKLIKNSEKDTMA